MPNSTSHGKGLVLANSIENYDQEISLDLTKLALEANLLAREKGYKPYIAPALSSGALSILKTLRNQWHYSSIYMGNTTKGAYFGHSLYAHVISHIDRFKGHP